MRAINLRKIYDEMEKGEGTWIHIPTHHSFDGRAKRRLQPNERNTQLCVCIVLFDMPNRLHSFYRVSAHIFFLFVIVVVVVPKLPLTSWRFALGIYVCVMFFLSFLYDFVALSPVLNVSFTLNVSTFLLNKNEESVGDSWYEIRLYMYIVFIYYFPNNDSITNRTHKRRC